jgi:hypothetical protein
VLNPFSTECGAAEAPQFRCRAVPQAPGRVLFFLTPQGLPKREDRGQRGLLYPSPRESWRACAGPSRPRFWLPATGRAVVESQRGHQGKTPRPRESQVGASGRARHSAPQLPPAWQRRIGLWACLPLRNVIPAASFETRNQIRTPQTELNGVVLCPKLSSLALGIGSWWFLGGIWGQNKAKVSVFNGSVR